MRRTTDGTASTATIGAAESLGSPADPGRGRTRRAALAVAAIAVLGLAGCASGPEPPNTVPEKNLPGEFAGAPDWVVQGCGASVAPASAETEGTEAAPLELCGVGSAGGSNNPALMRKAAVARARTEIARSLAVGVQSTLEEWRSTPAGAEALGSGRDGSEKLVELSRQVTDAGLGGSEHRETWISNNGTWYALVVLDAHRFRKVVSRTESLPPAVREAVEARADAIFAGVAAPTSAAPGRD